MYGMAKKPDFFHKTVNRFIGVGPCVFTNKPGPYPHYAIYAKKLFEEGVIFIPADGEQAPSVPKIDCAKSKKKGCEYEAGWPLASPLYFA